MASIPALNPEQAALWDRRTADDGVDPVALMECAGRGIVSVITARFPALVRQGTIVAAGPGNNGGDGWVVARALHALGLPVWVAPVPGTQSPLNALQERLARRDGVREVAGDGPWPDVGLAVDALLGTGATGRPRAPMAALVARLVDLAVPIVAVDGPTGLDLGDGVSHDALRATLTITFGGYRRGHLLARDEVGDLVVLDIGFRPPDPVWPTLFTAAHAARALARLPARSHKGTRGRVAIVGGSPGMVGAARLTARAAFATGAGLVHVVAPTESVRVIAQAEPDVQTAEWDFEGPPPKRADAPARLMPSALPRSGREPSRLRLVERVAELTAAPAVVDADALMVLAGQRGTIAPIAASRPVVMTPHAGEFRALFPEWASGLGVDPWRLAADAAAETGAVVLLKGVPTVIGDGRPDGVRRPAPITVAAGNPGLATGGTGDTLCGIIATCLAQGIDAAIAAAVGAQALGDAADLAARRGAARSLRPMDVALALPDVWRRWELLRDGPGPVVAPILHELPAPAAV